MSHAICSQWIFDGERLLPDHALVVAGETITRLCPVDQLSGDLPVVNLGEGTLAPGFIDAQVNGGGGVMLNNAPQRASVDQMTLGHRPTGTTTMMPTLISDTREKQQAGVDAVRAARAAGNRSVLGVHIEGPFFEPDRRGAHRASMIRPLKAADVLWLSALNDLPVIVTLAPEHTAAGQIRTLTEAGIMVCAGHTGARYQDISRAVDEGLRGFTHLYNAMTPLTSREPGTVGAALDFDNTFAGIIADGHHVHPASIRIAHRAKPAGKLILVTDAMATVGSNTSVCDIYGEHIEERDGRLINAEGVLAGSAIGMIDAVRIAHQLAGIPLEECLRMASAYPAAFLGVDDHLGLLGEDYRADLVHFNTDFTVTATWVAGEHLAHTAHNPPGDSALTPHSSGDRRT